MKLRPFSTWRQENKELLVFLAIAFALPFLWFLVPAIFSLTGNSLHSLSSFSLFNVLCPAAGAMVVSLVYRAEDPLLPRTFFRRFLGLTAIVGLWALCGLFLPEHFLSTVTPLLYFAVSLATIVFYLDEPSDLRAAYGLTGRQWTLSGVLLLLFLALLVVRAVANNLITGTPQAAFTAVSFSSLFLLLPSFFLQFSSFFGEEYGWRTYLQPALQTKSGPIRGVLLFGVLWALWHLPSSLSFDHDSLTQIGPSFLLSCLNCIAFGTFLAFIYLKTHNITTYGWLFSYIFVTTICHLCFLKPTHGYKPQPPPSFSWPSSSPFCSLTFFAVPHPPDQTKPKGVPSQCMHYCTKISA